MVYSTAVKGKLLVCHKHILLLEYSFRLLVRSLDFDVGKCGGGVGVSVLQRFWGHQGLAVGGVGLVGLTGRWVA